MRSTILTFYHHAVQAKNEEKKTEKRIQGFIDQHLCKDKSNPRGLISAHFSNEFLVAIDS